jgi:hypothetical protein
MTVLITLTTAGTDSGPFDLYSNLDGYLSAFATGVTKSALLAGYASSVVPDYTTTIRVVSVGDCTNFIDISLSGITTTTTSSTSSSTSTSTTTTTHTTAPPGPVTINLSNASSGCPAPVSSYPIAVTLDSYPIVVGSVLSGGLPPAGLSYYTSPTFGLIFDAFGIVTTIIDCGPPP